MADELTETASESGSEDSTLADLVAELNAFEPSDDSDDNDERLQIWVDRWEETPDKESALGAMFNVFERNPENTLMGEPGSLVHAIEEVPGYEQELAASLERSPSYYGVWMVNRILEEDHPAEARSYWLEMLKRLASSDSVPESVAGTAREFLSFQEG